MLFQRTICNMQTDAIVVFRSRHKSDSSTSLMSDSSLPAAQSNNKQGTSKKSKYVCMLQFRQYSQV